MWPDMQRRSAAAELMDDRSIGGAELGEALAQLRLINATLGAAWPTIEGVDHFWRSAGQPTRLRILDVGAGSGDISKALLSWAEHQHVQLQLVLVDIHPETCAAAAHAHRNQPQVAVVCSDLLQLGLQPVDIVTSALFTHHFSQELLPAVYRAMVNVARYGVVVNDLHRHPLAWLGIWLGTRLLSRNRMIRHDAPLSVLRGFQVADIRQACARAGLHGVQCLWRPLFRYLILIPGQCHAG